MEKIYLISNLALWIIVIIQLIFLYLLTKSLALFIDKFHKKTETSTESNLLVKKGDNIPVFSAKDQWNNKINSLYFNGVVTKLLFLSDTCGTCIDVLKQLSQKSSTDYLVIKDNNDKSSLYLDDKEHKFPIVRSTEIMKMFGIKKVPLLVFLDKDGIINSTAEISDSSNLNLLFDN